MYRKYSSQKIGHEKAMSKMGAFADGSPNTESHDNLKAMFAHV